MIEIIIGNKIYGNKNWRNFIFGFVVFKYNSVNILDNYFSRKTKVVIAVDFGFFSEQAIATI